MAEHDITPEVAISKTQRRYKVGYVQTRHINSKTYADHVLLDTPA